MIPVPAGKTIVKIRDNKDFQSFYYIDGYLSDYSSDAGEGHSDLCAILIDLLTGTFSLFYFSDPPFIAVQMREVDGLI